MDRVNVYTGETLYETDVLQTNLNAYNAISRLAEAIFGTPTLLNGLVCQATAPASLSVDVLPGEIYIQEVTDATDYGVIPANPAIITKQGILYTKVNLLTPAPGTVGNSINYLVQIAFSEVDGDSASRPFYQASPQTVDQQRLDECVVAVKAGTMAPTGTQVTPSPDAGYVAARVVTVAYGQTTVISGNINTPGGAPFLTETLLDKISQATADGRYSQITATQSGSVNYAADTGTANVYAIALTPAIASYVTGARYYMKALNANTGASTLNVNAQGAKTITKQNGDPLLVGDIVVSGEYELIYDGTNMQLIGAAPVKIIQGGTWNYILDTGAANAYIATLVPAPAAYTTGMRVWVKIANTNTTASTINVNGLGVKNITTARVAALGANALVTGMIAELAYDGTEFLLLNPANVFSRIVVQTFTSSGTYTPTAGMQYCIGEVVGGGAAGGGATTGAGLQASSGGGGGAGAYAKKVITAATIGASQAITIGAAGTAGTAGNNPGNNGGTSSLGAIISCTGGLGGNGLASSAIISAGAPGGDGGTATGGDINISGAYGLIGQVNGTNGQALSGGGANSHYGRGGPSIYAPLAGVAGLNYGSGGSGAGATSTGSFAGGPGSAGLVIITEFIA